MRRPRAPRGATRQAIQERLRRRQAVRVEIVEYAAAVAGSRADLDTELEAVAVEILLTKAGPRRPPAHQL